MIGCESGVNSLGYSRCIRNKRPVCTARALGRPTANREESAGLRAQANCEESASEVKIASTKYLEAAKPRREKRGLAFVVLPADGPPTALSIHPRRMRRPVLQAERAERISTGLQTLADR